MCLQEMKRLICRKVCLKRLTKFKEKKKFDRPTTLLPGSVGSFLTCICMMNFRVPDAVLIVLRY